MFLDKQTNKERTEYKKNLQLIGSLSLLYSESKIPYLYYRIAEMLFCNAFNAENLSRSDVSIDAKKDNIGIGLKTFRGGNNQTFQKIAEFNQALNLYKGLKGKPLIKKIAELRNKRIRVAETLHKIDKSIYHCVLRKEKKFQIFENSMDEININNIQNIKKGPRGNTILFNDGINDYSFSLSKSTLSKRFTTDSIIQEFNIKILKNPLLDLRKCFLHNKTFLKNTKIQQTIYLPLYGKNMQVHKKSGLNHWNAEGRKRDLNEVYIPVPTIIHEVFPNFFPDQGTLFSLKLPNGDSLDSKICQDRGKALMSNPNKDLGKWILRDILKLKENTLVTYEKLQDLDIDSIRIDKIDDTTFEINFSKSGSYKNFENNIKK